MQRTALTIALIAALAHAVPLLAADSVLEQARSMFEPVPDTPPVLAGNPASPARVELGKMLYFEPRLSASQVISCNTCHNVGLGGVDLLETSVGHGWQTGPRNSPTVFNAVFNLAQFWDGRAKDLAEQAKGPVQASVEMNNTPERVVATLKSMPEYVALFSQAFPGEQDPVSFDNMARAIEVFEATLITPNDPFDQYLKGNANAMTTDQHEGLALFMDKGCVSCHEGVNLGGTDYFPFGVFEKPAADVLPAGDVGRFEVTNTAGDEYVFKSPSLRNIALTPPYFHSGKVWDLQDAVMIMGSAQLGIELTAEESRLITEFMRALTGDQPRVVHPTLPPNTATTPRPVLMVPTGG